MVPPQKVGFRRRSVRIWAAITLGAASLAFILPVFGEDTASTAPDAHALGEYTQLFGAEESRVEASKAPRDWAKFAAKLLDSAKSLKDDPALVDVLWEKAVTFGLKSKEGYGSAIIALRKIMAAHPADREKYRPKLMALERVEVKQVIGADRVGIANELYDELLAEGDELTKDHKYADAMRDYREALTVPRGGSASEANERVRALQNKIALTEKLTKLDAKIQASNNDPTLNAQAMHLCLFELDDPMLAAKYADKSGDEDAKKVVPMLGSSKALTEQEQLDAADWYRKVAKTLKGDERTAALQRAVALYEGYLQSHEKRDADRLRVESGLSDALDQAWSAAGRPAYTADKIVIYNTHNSWGNDRGASELAVSLSYRGREVWARKAIPIAWEANKDPQVTIYPPRVRFDKVRVDVTKWHGIGGGLTEVLVLLGDDDLARGCKVTVNGTLDGKAVGQFLTDGIVASDQLNKGYWLMPNNAPGWAEIDLNVKATVGK